jgi:hypothetical protein
VWKKRDGINGLTNQGVFGLKLLGTYMPAHKQLTPNGHNGGVSSRSSSSGGGRNDTPVGDDSECMSLLSEISDMLKTSQVTPVHLQRLCGSYFGSYGRDNPDNIEITETLLAAMKTPLNYIRHSILMDLFILYLVHPTKQIAKPQHRRLISLLSISCGSIYNDNPEMITGNNLKKNELKSILELERNLILTRDICNELSKGLMVLNSYDRPKELIPLISSPLISVCILTWIQLLLNDNEYTRKNIFLNILPVLLQFIVEAEQHIYQRPMCCELFKRYSFLYVYV